MPSSLISLRDYLISISFHMATFELFEFDFAGADYLSPSYALSTDYFKRHSNAPLVTTTYPKACDIHYQHLFANIFKIFQTNKIHKGR